MNTRVRITSQTMKASSKHGKVANFDSDFKWPMEKPQMQGNKVAEAEKETNRRRSSRERKMALQQDVDKLKKKLRYEENVHRALERAFTRPLGALPRLPPYLPPYTLELLAEVAVLEEEVIRLEEQLVNFRQGLYQEAVYISTSNKTIEDLYELSPNKNSKAEQPKVSSLDLGSIPCGSLTFSSDDSNAMPPSSDVSTDQTRQCSARPLIGKQTPKKIQRCSSPEDGCGKENQSHTNSQKNKQSQSERMKHSARRLSVDSITMDKHLSPQKLPQECQVTEEERIKGISPSVSSRKGLDDQKNGPNKISENIMKCLSSIFLRMNSSKASETEFDISPSISGSSSCDASDETGFRDPYGICAEFGRRDIGPYKHLRTIDGNLIVPNRVTASSFLMRRLKDLLGKLASVDLWALTQQQKLAFWINIYNACMMNAYIEHGIPSSPQMVVALMRKAIINVGGHSLTAMTIEHFILRMPYHSKSTHLRFLKNDEVTIRSIFGLDWPEPMVTFALSCGSWSSPAVRVYTASQIENELQEAKRDYLQAAVGISTTRLAIPKLLDWYLLDFAKDLDSLLDWICLQLPCEVRKDALKCLERGRKEAFSTTIQVLPYKFNFRYLLAP